MLPVGWSALSIVNLQSALIVGGFIAEYGLECRVSLRIVSDQLIPVVVAKFMTEVAKQGSVALTQFDTPLLSFGGISLGNVECNQSIVMASKYPLKTFPTIRRVTKEIESKSSAISYAGLWRERKPEEDE